MAKHHKTKSASHLEYTGRQIRRVAFIIMGLFILFVIIMAIVWAVPKIWHWAIG
jgi:hypothetical protein